MIRPVNSNSHPSEDASELATAVAHFPKQRVPVEWCPRPNTQVPRHAHKSKTAPSCAPLPATNISRPSQPSMEPSSQAKGQADSYTKIMPPGTDQQSTCMSLPFTERNACYIQSSPDHTEQQQSPVILGSPLQPLMIRIPSQDSIPEFYDHMIPYDQCQPKTEDIWPTPPAEPEDFGPVRYQQQQQQQHQQSSPVDDQEASYTHRDLMRSTTSPSSQHWALASTHSTRLHSTDELRMQQQQQQQSNVDLRTFTPVSSTTSDIRFSFNQADSKSTYSCNFSSGYDTSPTGAQSDQYPSPDLSYSMPSTTVGSSRSSVQGCTSSKRPASRQSKSRDAAEPGPGPTTLSSLRMSPKSAARPLAPTRGGGDVACGGSGGGSSAKTTEPYAKLIERALLSRSNYTMTLQEIYQWFEENTDKSKTEGKGWQNSIRHNLSMNAAFSKNEPKMDDGAVASRDPKRSTEWVLADWAVKDGVQSTTRYRKTNTSRKAVTTRLWGEPYSLDFRPGPAAGSRRSSLAHGFGPGTLRGQAFPSGHMSQGLLPLSTATTTAGIDARAMSASSEHVFPSPASMYAHGQQFSVSPIVGTGYNTPREQPMGMLVSSSAGSHQDHHHHHHNGFFDGGWMETQAPFDHQAVAAGDSGGMCYNLQQDYIHGLPYNES